MIIFFLFVGARKQLCKFLWWSETNMVTLFWHRKEYYKLCQTGTYIHSKRDTRTVNSRLADTPLLPTLAITDEIQIPIYRGLTENDSWYYGFSLFWTRKHCPDGVGYNESWLYWLYIYLPTVEIIPFFWTLDFSSLLIAQTKHHFPSLSATQKFYHHFLKPAQQFLESIFVFFGGLTDHASTVSLDLYYEPTFLRNGSTWNIAVLAFTLVSYHHCPGSLQITCNLGPVYMEVGWPG